MTRHRLSTALAALALMAGSLVFAAPAAGKECYSPDQRSQERAFSRVVTTTGGKTLWLAGMTGNPSSTFEQQVREIFSGLEAGIKANGGSGLADMVTMTVFITDTRLGDRFTELRKQTFKECFPASALITVTGLAQPGLLIEIQGIAVVEGR
jgi:2-iminobutanoate/2-iminopropanoate deaminase